MNSMRGAAAYLELTFERWARKEFVGSLAYLTVLLALLLLDRPNPL